jgi:hypothetical protein
MGASDVGANANSCCGLTQARFTQTHAQSNH